MEMYLSSSPGSSLLAVGINCSGGEKLRARAVISMERGGCEDNYTLLVVVTPDLLDG